MVDGISRDARVDDTDRCADRFREDVGRGAAMQEIQHHLPGNRRRIGRNAIARDPVVGGEYGQLARFQARCRLAGGACELQRDGFHLSQSAQRLGLAVDQLPDGTVEIVGSFRHGAQRGASPLSHPARALPGSPISSTESYHQASHPTSGMPVNSIRLSG